MNVVNSNGVMKTAVAQDLRGIGYERADVRCQLGYEAKPSNTSDEARAVKIVCRALREFYSGYAKEYQKVREENEKYLRSEVYIVLSDNKDGLREPLKKTVNLAAELMLGLLSKPVVVQ